MNIGVDIDDRLIFIIKAIKKCITANKIPYASIADLLFKHNNAHSSSSRVAVNINNTNVG